MKNFITDGSRLAVAALFALGVSACFAPAQAAECLFRPNAPDQHTVVRGDTLWDISGKFLEHPWCWPQVWGINRAEIANPHWIYPGQIVYFDRRNGRLSLQRPGSGEGADGLPTTRLSPQLRTEGMGADAISSIPAGAIEPFLTMPLIVDEDTLSAAPRIVAEEGEHGMITKGDKMYVRGPLNGASNFQVFRPGTPLRDPDTGKVIAYEAVYLGSAGLKTLAQRGVDVHTFIVASSPQEMVVGDRLVPTPPMPLRNYVPHTPARQVQARVLGIYSGVTYAGQNQVISVNRGALDGLDVGAVLQLYHFGGTIVDPERKGVMGAGKTMLKLPDEQVGSLFIFRVFKNVSYGLIMQTTQPVQVGDVANSPE